MTAAEYVKSFFKNIEDIWAEIPGPVKVFLYASISSAFGSWASGGLEWREVIIIVATNLGIYQIPRTLGTTVKKAL